MRNIVIHTSLAYFLSGLGLDLGLDGRLPDTGFGLENADFETTLTCLNDKLFRQK